MYRYVCVYTLTVIYDTYTYETPLSMMHACICNIWVYMCIYIYIHIYIDCYVWYVHVWNPVSMMHTCVIHTYIIDRYIDDSFNDMLAYSDVYFLFVFGFRLDWYLYNGVCCAHTPPRTRIYIVSLCSHCNELQHAATHCNALQHAATRYNMLQHTATRYNAPHYVDSVVSACAGTRI